MTRKRWLAGVLCAGFLFLGGCARAQEVEPATEWSYAVSWEALSRTDDIRLVNKENLLSSDDTPRDLVKIKVKRTSSSAIQMRDHVSQALDAMFAAAKEDGITLYAHSGYRSYGTQRTMYNNRLKQNKGKDDGVVAYPGASDHQTGLGIDVISKAWIGKRFNAQFAQTAEAQWMAAHCAEYGFIIRYPEGKEEITGIIYEPWHLRYVGEEAAAYIMESGLCLEEFTQQWQSALAAYQAIHGPGVTPDSPGEQPVPQAITLEETGEDGDAEVSLFQQ